MSSKLHKALLVPNIMYLVFLMLRVSLLILNQLHRSCHHSAYLLEYANVTSIKCTAADDSLMLSLSWKLNTDVMIGLPHKSVVPSAVQRRLLTLQHFVTAVLCSSTSTVPWHSLPGSINQSSAAVHLIEVTLAYSSRYALWWQLRWSTAVAIQVLCYSVTAWLRCKITPHCRVPTQ